MWCFKVNSTHKYFVFIKPSVVLVPYGVLLLLLLLLHKLKITSVSRTSWWLTPWLAHVVVPCFGLQYNTANYSNSNNKNKTKINNTKKEEQQYQWLVSILPVRKKTVLLRVPLAAVAVSRPKCPVRVLCPPPSVIEKKKGKQDKHDKTG